MAKERVTTGGSKKRAKSLRSLRQQYERLLEDPNLTDKRRDVIDNAVRRYASNIHNSKDGQKSYARLKEVYTKSDLDKVLEKQYTGYQDASTTRAVASTNG